MPTKKCLYCEVDFHVPKCRVGKAKYCSTHCKYEHKKKIGRKLKDCKCKFCGKDFKVEKRQLGKYCSEECFHLSKRVRIKKECKNCGKIFEIKKTTTMDCCSMDCRLEYQSKHRVDRSFYSTSEWRKTRMRVLVRDDFTCTKCGNETMELHVHHIVPVSKGGSDLIDNLKALCIKCHREEHGYRIKTIS